jgi:hypothetical protein
VREVEAGANASGQQPAEFAACTLAELRRKSKFTGEKKRILAGPASNEGESFAACLLGERTLCNVDIHDHAAGVFAYTGSRRHIPMCIERSRVLIEFVKQKLRAVLIW